MIETVVKITTITRAPILATPIDRNPVEIVITMITRTLIKVTAIIREKIELTRILQ